MNGTHTGAFDLARRFRLRVARMSSSSAEVEYSGGGVAEVDPDLDDLELSTPPPRAVGRSRGLAARDSVDDFDPDELIAGHGIAHGSPAPRSASAPTGARRWSSRRTSASRRARCPPEQVEALAHMHEEYDDDSAILHSRAPDPGMWSEGNGRTYERDARYTGHASPEEALEAQLDDDALGEDIDQGVAAELGGHDEDLPFDPADGASVRRGYGQEPDRRRVRHGLRGDEPAAPGRARGFRRARGRRSSGLRGRQRCGRWPRGRGLVRSVRCRRPRRCDRDERGSRRQRGTRRGLRRGRPRRGGLLRGPGHVPRGSRRAARAAPALSESSARDGEGARGREPRARRATADRYAARGPRGRSDARRRGRAGLLADRADRRHGRARARRARRDRGDPRRHRGGLARSARGDRGPVRRLRTSASRA